MIPPRCIYTATEQLHIIAGLYFSCKCLLRIIKKSKCTEIDTRTPYCYCILCSNVKLTTVVNYRQFVCRTRHKVTLVSLQPHNYVRPLHNCYLVNGTKLRVFGGHFIVRHQAEYTSLCTVDYNTQNTSLYTSLQTLKLFYLLPFYHRQYFILNPFI